jgi:hypothetical protein
MRWDEMRWMRLTYSLTSFRAAGKLRTEGRTYTVQDGDILFFKVRIECAKKIERRVWWVFIGSSLTLDWGMCLARSGKFKEEVRPCSKLFSKHYSHYTRTSGKGFSCWVDSRPTHSQLHLSNRLTFEESHTTKKRECFYIYCVCLYSAFCGFHTQIKHLLSLSYSYNSRIQPTNCKHD